MARPLSTPLDLAAPRTTLTLTLRAALLTAAVATLTACSTPTGPEPAGTNRPSLGGIVRTDPTGSADGPSFGGATTTIDPGAPEYRPNAGRNTGQNGGEDVTVAGGQDPIGGGSDY